MTHLATMYIVTDRRTDDIMMPIADRLKVRKQLWWIDWTVQLRLKKSKLFNRLQTSALSFWLRIRTTYIHTGTPTLYSYNYNLQFIVLFQKHNGVNSKIWST